jgi:hypothetical protein
MQNSRGTRDDVSVASDDVYGGCCTAAPVIINQSSYAKMMVCRIFAMHQPPGSAGLRQCRGDQLSQRRACSIRKSRKAPMRREPRNSLG